MGAQLLSAKIIVQEEEPRIRTAPAPATAVNAMVGITERGPMGVPIVINSWEEYVKIFGGFMADGDLPLQAWGFFREGGETLWVMRTCHYTDINDENSFTATMGEDTIQTDAGGPTKGVVAGAAGPYLLEDGDTLIVNTDTGSPIGTGVFNATVGGVTGSSGTYPTTWVGGEAFQLKFNDGTTQTITFTVAAQNLTDVLDEINAAIINGKALDLGGEVRLESDTKGSGSKVEIIAGGTALAALGLSAGTSNGTGDAVNIAETTAAEIATVLNALTDVSCAVVGGLPTLERDTAGDTYWVQIDASSTADGKVGFDNTQHYGTLGAAIDTFKAKGKYYGSYTEVLSVLIENAINGQAEAFNVIILKDGIIQETWPNVDMDSLEAILNDIYTGSDLLTFEDLVAPGTLLQRRPANGTYGPLAGGGDGLTSLADIDFVGSDAGDTGMYGLDTVQGVTLLAVPGQATSAIHNAMIQYCEVHRNGKIFPILDCPAGLSAAQMVAYQTTTANLWNLSEFGAIQWPRIKVLNPNTLVYGIDKQISVPTSGFVAGVYARQDGVREGGIYEAPAGVERGIIKSALGLETKEALDERKLDLVYPVRINPITTFEGAPIHIDGSRTLKSGGNWPSIPERRGVIYIETAISFLLLFAKHSNNNPTLRNRMRRSANAFLRLQMKNGAFRSNKPDQAYFIDVSEKINPPSMVFANKLKMRIGLATNKPAEWIILSFSQDTRALEEELATS